MKKIVILLSVAVFLCGCNDQPSLETSLSQDIPTANGEGVHATPTDPEIEAVKELLKKSHLAVCNDDAAAFAQCYVASDTMKSLIDTIFAGAKIQYQLEEAIVERFGEEGLDLFRDSYDNPDRLNGAYAFSFMAPPKDEAWWDDPDIDIEIDRDDLVGLYTNPWSNTTTPLRKQEERWLFDLTQNFVTEQISSPDDLAYLEEVQNSILKGMQNCIDLLKQENVRVIDLNIEMGKPLRMLMFGNDEDQLE